MPQSQTDTSKPDNHLNVRKEKPAEEIDGFVSGPSGLMPAFFGRLL